ncbi:hypothetical protein BCR44DRAFT_1425551 [Catenaria anguillulae PL171]|uniref:Uncharacterized protein n=1 Tax=Catenaria anguillulae PL171 TaxID=765915 RepID=A0A1Y2I2W4_9FUNG|nr:hypothetical protein BCR44DRAFT_1425551 [Catenaria anguillulae PL171]
MGKSSRGKSVPTCMARRSITHVPSASSALLEWATCSQSSSSSNHPTMVMLSIPVSPLPKQGIFIVTSAHLHAAYSLLTRQTITAGARIPRGCRVAAGNYGHAHEYARADVATHDRRERRGVLICHAEPTW